MWNKLPFSEYCISFHNQQKQIYLTDFISIWYKCFCAQEFATCLKESNRLLEIEEAILSSKAVDMLQNVHTLSKVHTSKAENNSIVLEITRVEGFPVKLKVSLNEGCKVMFFHRVTQPLLQSVNDLRSSEKKLSQLLLRKDKEIKEYKEEGGKIALRHLKTPIFDDKLHHINHSTYSINFGFTDVPVEIMCREQKVKIEPHVTQDNLATSVTMKKEVNANSIKQEYLATNSINEEPGIMCPAAVKCESPSGLGIKQEPFTQTTGASPRKRKKVLNL